MLPFFRSWFRDGMLPFFRKTVFSKLIGRFLIRWCFFDVEALLFEHFKDLGLPRALWRVDCVNSFFFTSFDIQIGVFWGAWGTIGS